MAEKSQADQKPQIKNQPPEYQDDLNPDRGASHYTVTGDPNHRTALQIKPLKLKLQRVLSDVQIGQIAIVPAGTKLKQGAVYLDLMDSDSPPFTAHERMFAREDQWLIPKHETPYEIWNVLSGHYIT